MTGAQSAVNGLYILVDALRYDVIADERLCDAVAPTLAVLRREGRLARVIANASNTQFVMPSLLTGTLPLDHGGTNRGCLDRPATFAELLSEAGYQTGLITTCILYSRALGFDRGFDRVIAPVSPRRALMQDVEYGIAELLRRWKTGRLGKPALIGALQNEYGAVLANLQRVVADAGRIPRRFHELHRQARLMADGLARERDNLFHAPDLVLSRLLEVPDTFSYVALGRRSWRAQLLLAKIRNRAYRAVGSLFRRWLRVKMPDTHEPIAPEIADCLPQMLAGMQKPWFMMVHLMDVHSHWPLFDEFLRHPLATVARVRRERRIARLAGAGDDPELLRYLGALSRVDGVIRDWLDHLERSGVRDRTMVFVGSDHGATLQALDGRTVPDLDRRFLRSCLETPFVVTGPGMQGPPVEGLFDSRDVGATILAAMNVPASERHAGRSMLSQPGRDFVISENAGRGYCDVLSDRLNFSVLGPRLKAYVTLEGKVLEINGIYDYVADSMELHPLPPGTKTEICASTFIESIWNVRGDILTQRGVKRPEQ